MIRERESFKLTSAFLPAKCPHGQELGWGCTQTPYLLYYALFTLLLPSPLPTPLHTHTPCLSGSPSCCLLSQHRLQSLWGSDCLSTACLSSTLHVGAPVPDWHPLPKMPLLLQQHAALGPGNPHPAPF